jgi:hypothetical protein
VVFLVGLELGRGGGVGRGFWLLGSSEESRHICGVTIHEGVSLNVV